MALAPQLPIPYLNLGAALRAAGHYDQAEEVLRRAQDKKFQGFSLHQELYAMCDNAKAKRSYQDFLTIWKDADPDIPLLIQAKAEYAKLQ